MQDLSSARIGLRHPDRPSPAIAVGPLDGGITLVQRIGPFGQIFDDKRVAKSRLLKCLIPPQSTFSRGRADRFRNSLVEIEDNRLYRIAHGGRGLLPFQTPDGKLGLGSRI